MGSSQARPDRKIGQAHLPSDTVPGTNDGLFFDFLAPYLLNKKARKWIRFFSGSLTD
jgi:hypothetical protein